MLKNILHTKIYFEDLPHYETGGYQGKINWKLVSGYKVRFEYNDIQGIITILSYDNKERKLQIEYLNNIYTIYQASFLKEQISCAIGKKIIGYKYSIGDVITNNDHNITILDRTIDNSQKRKYKYQCNICGNIDWCFEKVISDGKYICNVCVNHKIIVGVNDIPTTDPWMIPYFQGGYDEAKNFTSGSKYKFYPKCPECGKIKKNKMCIMTLKRTKSIACTCSDGISYPNKFMYKLLEQLKIDFINEYSPEWISPKRYDFYIPSKKLIIEMDGGLGHGKKIHHKSKISLEKTIDIDKEKDFIAKQHGIDVIRINADKSEFEYLTDNIYKSLSSLIDLHNIDWKECENYALSNRIKFVCDFYENNKPISTLEMQEKIKINKNTIVKYLKRGRKIGWTDYDPKKSNENGRRKASKYMKNTFSKKVYVYDINGNFIKEYSSLHDVQEKSVDDFGFFLSYKVVSKVCNHIMNSYKSFIFTYEKDDINLNCDIRKYNRRVSCFDCNMNFINEYESIADANRKTNIPISTITKCCKGITKNPRNYIWIYSDMKKEIQNRQLKIG